jgi:hypothetical protein
MPFRFLALSWFLLVFLSGYFYSVYVNAVLQFSVLIFVFPFLLLFLFSFIRESGKWLNAILVFVILLAGTLSLSLERRYFSLFYKQPYAETYKNIIEIQDRLGKDKVTFLINLWEKEYFTYYEKKYGRFIQSPVWHFENLTLGEFRNLVDSLKTPAVFIGMIAPCPAEYFRLAEAAYPCLDFKDDGFTYSNFLLKKKNRPSCIKRELFSSAADFGSSAPYWSYNSEHVIPDSSKALDRFCYLFDSLNEWGPTFTCPLEKIVANKHDVVSFKVDILTREQAVSPILVISIDNDSGNKMWYGVDGSKYSITPGKWTTIFASVPLSDARLSGSNLVLKAYLWNKEKGNFQAKNFSVTISKGNKYKYWMIEPL